MTTNDRSSYVRPKLGSYYPAAYSASNHVDGSWASIEAGAVVQVNDRDDARHDFKADVVQIDARQTSNGYTVVCAFGTGETLAYRPDELLVVQTRAQSKAEARRKAAANRVPSSSKCRNCGYDLRGMYPSDRQAHRDGYCS